MKKGLKRRERKGVFATDTLLTNSLNFVLKKK